MKMARHEPVGKSESLLRHLTGLVDQIRSAAQEGQATDEVERDIWKRVLALGKECLGQFFMLQGTGDLGETVTLPDGQECQRLDGLRERVYQSIFGEFRLRRTVYGSRAGQKIEFVPLDNRLQLPAGVYSYVLQDWDQSLCAEEAFGQVQGTIARMLGLKQPVASLEEMNRDMAEQVQSYLINQPTPPAAEEGEVLVASADGKGIVMRGAGKSPVHRSKGEKASVKRMATVGAVYTVDRYLRSAEEVVAALFRDEPKPQSKRPETQHKHVWASLQQDDPEAGLSGYQAVYAWMAWEVAVRNPGRRKELVFIGDGQESLWEARREYLPTENAVDILDLLHVTPRLWQAAHLFYGEGSDDVPTFVRERVLRILKGQVDGVIRGLREMGTKRGLSGSKKKSLIVICNYLAKNRERMRYDRYLAAGYPIASGVIEGACRHLVKDRMERAGMHWTAAGAQAMLDVRSIHVMGAWDEYQAYRIDMENRRLYPHRHLVAGPNFTLAA